MKLLSLKLEHFQGIRALDFDFDGRSASIYGDNATGKTTVFNALTWLLFDKASTGAKNFTPKTRGPEGELHGLDHAAEGRFQLEDGRIFTLKKVFKEVWKKKKGAATAEFSGNTLDYYLDGVPVKEQEYAATLVNYFTGAERGMVLTMPTYFSEQLSWDRRRAILLEVCGDVSDEDVIASTQELKDLPGRLIIPGTIDRKYTVGEYKKLMTARRTEINRQLQEIPGRVDEATRAMSDVGGLDVEALRMRRQAIAEERARVERERAQALADGADAAAAKALAEARQKLTDARNSYNERMSQISSARRLKLEALQDQLAQTRRAWDKARGEMEAATAERDRLQRLREALLKDYDEVQAVRWDENQEVCPTCGRSLPEEQVSRLKEEFNLKKSRKLEDINARGQREANKEMLKAATEKIDECLTQSVVAKAKVEKLEAQVQEASGRAGWESFETTEEHSALSAEIKIRQAAVDAGTADLDAVAAPYNSKLEELSSRQKENAQQLVKLEAAQVQKKRVSELKSQEKQLTTEYESVEHGIYLCELFVKTKVAMLTDHINSKFRSVRFRLFQEQLNGGVKEDCEVIIPAPDGSLIPYNVANNAARICAGLEIISTLALHWGLTMPVFIDNAEGVTRLPGIEAQIVRLVVSAADPALRMELDGDASGLQEAG